MLQYSIIREIPIVGKKSQYELKSKEHIHLICTECGFVEDEYRDSLCDEKFSHLASKNTFLFSRSQINIYGLCKKCQI